MFKPCCSLFLFIFCLLLSPSLTYAKDFTTVHFLQDSFEPVTNADPGRDTSTSESNRKTIPSMDTCHQIHCLVWARISLSEQQMYLYREGVLTDTFLVSTGIAKRETPLMELHPSGPTYTKYTSKKFPEGNYMGLGNMPYVVFIRGGYAIHGTTMGNARKLGKKASHGCIRLHPDNGKIFFDLVRKVGLENVWISIER